jgi:hypothetical protein
MRREQQIPAGNDRQNSKCKCKSKGKDKSGFFAALRMTNLIGCCAQNDKSEEQENWFGNLVWPPVLACLDTGIWDGFARCARLALWPYNNS